MEVGSGQSEGGGSLVATGVEVMRLFLSSNGSDGSDIEGKNNSPHRYISLLSMWSPHLKNRGKRLQDKDGVL